MGQLAKEDLLGDTRVFHAYHMSAAGLQSREPQCLDTEAREDLRVRDLALPSDMGDLPKASLVELIELLDVTTT